MGHFGNPRVERLAVEIQDTFKKVTQTSYPLKYASSYWIAIIDLANEETRMRKMLSTSWEAVSFSLGDIREFLAAE